MIETHAVLWNTETIKAKGGNHLNTFLAATETINKPTTETMKNVPCHSGNHKQTSDGN